MDNMNAAALTSMSDSLHGATIPADVGEPILALLVVVILLSNQGQYYALIIFISEIRRLPRQRYIFSISARRTLHFRIHRLSAQGWLCVRVLISLSDLFNSPRSLPLKGPSAIPAFSRSVHMPKVETLRVSL